MTEPPSSAAAPPSGAPFPSSASLRADVVRLLEAALPAMFAASPDLRTLGLFVAQYWNDEADDAVHGDVRFSFEHTHDATKLRSVEDRWEMDEDDPLADVMDRLERATPALPNSNDDMIAAFAAYAPETTQDDPQYAPYALFHRRDDGGFTTTIVGTMCRPEWEDRPPDWRAAQRADAARTTKRRAVVVAGVAAAIAVVVALLASLR